MTLIESVSQPSPAGGPGGAWDGMGQGAMIGVDRPPSLLLLLICGFTVRFRGGSPNFAHPPAALFLA